MRNFNSKLLSKSLLFGFLLAIFFIVPDLNAKEYTFDFHRVIETDDNLTLDMTYLEGNLTVVGSEDNRLIIEAKKRVNAVSQSEAELVQSYIEIKVMQDGSLVRVATNYLKMRNRGKSFWQKLLGTGGEDSFGEVDWRISLPSYCNIKVANTNGQMNFSNIQGNVTVLTSASDIELSSIEGDIAIENSNGITKGELLFGTVSVRQTQGKISLQWIEGDIQVRSSSAEIILRQDRGAIDLTTSTGKVTIHTELDSSRDFFVATESGSINLLIPESSSGKLDIRSQSGEIKTEIPISINSMTRKQVVGEFGFGGVSISLSSISGDVTVAQF